MAGKVLIISGSECDNRLLRCLAEAKKSLSMVPLLTLKPPTRSNTVDPEANDVAGAWHYCYTPEAFERFCNDTLWRGEHRGHPCALSRNSARYALEVAGKRFVVSDLPVTAVERFWEFASEGLRASLCCVFLSRGEPDEDASVQSSDVPFEIIPKAHLMDPPQKCEEIMKLVAAETASKEFEAA